MSLNVRKSISLCYVIWYKCNDCFSMYSHLHDCFVEQQVQGALFHPKVLLPLFVGHHIGVLKVGVHVIFWIMYVCMYADII
jgi:hypothetical protein